MRGLSAVPWMIQLIVTDGRDKPRGPYGADDNNNR